MIIILILKCYLRKGWCAWHHDNHYEATGVWTWKKEEEEGDAREKKKYIAKEKEKKRGRHKNILVSTFYISPSSFHLFIQIERGEGQPVMVACRGWTLVMLNSWIQSVTFLSLFPLTVAKLLVSKGVVNVVVPRPWVGEEKYSLQIFNKSFIFMLNLSCM